MSGVGLTVPKLLPITGTWAAPFTLYYLLLSSRTTSSASSPITTSATSCPLPKHKLHLSPPIPLLIMTIADRFTLPWRLPRERSFGIDLPRRRRANGGNRKALSYAMAVLLALRVAHADFGLRLKGKFGGYGAGRPLGYFGSNGILLGLSGYAAWLVKGYWVSRR